MLISRFIIVFWVITGIDLHALLRKKCIGFHTRSSVLAPVSLRACSPALQIPSLL